MKPSLLATCIGLFLLGQVPLTARGAHPLITEDTSTQGAGNHQLELTYDSSHLEDGASQTREESLSAILSMGILDDLDFIFGLPYERVTERVGAKRTRGLGDSEIAFKWRFYEADEFSLAVRPALGLPTANENEDLSSEHYSPSVFAVMTYSPDPWSIHLHLGYTRNYHDGHDQRDHIYHGSFALEYGINDYLRVVGDAGVESNSERAGPPGVGSVVLGLIYSPTPDIDIDLGYRIGLTDAAPDRTWLAGLALRF